MSKLTILAKTDRRSNFDKLVDDLNQAERANIQRRVVRHPKNIMAKAEIAHSLGRISSADLCKLDLMVRNDVVLSHKLVDALNRVQKPSVSK